MSDKKTKIKSLTPEQESKLDLYRKKWIDIGLNSEPFTYEEARPIMDNFYREVFKTDPPIIIIMENPLTTWYATLLCQAIFNEESLHVWSYIQRCLSEIREEFSKKIFKDIDKPSASDKIGEIIGNLYDFMESSLKENIRKSAVKDGKKQSLQEIVNQRILETAQKTEDVLGSIKKEFTDKTSTDLRDVIRDNFIKVYEIICEIIHNEIKSSTVNYLDKNKHLRRGDNNDTVESLTSEVSAINSQIINLKYNNHQVLKENSEKLYREDYRPDIFREIPSIKKNLEVIIQKELNLILKNFHDIRYVNVLKGNINVKMPAESDDAIKTVFDIERLKDNTFEKIFDEIKDQFKSIDLDYLEKNQKSRLNLRELLQNLRSDLHKKIGRAKGLRDIITTSLNIEKETRGNVRDYLKSLEDVWKLSYDEAFTIIKTQAREKFFSTYSFTDVEEDRLKKVFDKIINELFVTVEENISTEIKEISWDILWKFIYENILPELSSTNYIIPDTCGQFDAGYFSFYDFFFSEVSPCNTPSWKSLCDTSKLSLIYPLKNVCVLCQKPTEIHIKGGRLHKDGGPAVSYNNFKIWSLEGVRVSQWLAETPSDKLELFKVLALVNAEERMIGIKKIGIERLKEWGNIIDKQEDYELIDMCNVFKINTHAPYLFMKNPSTGNIHAEGVPNSIDTIAQALAWRNGSFETPLVLT